MAILMSVSGKFYEIPEEQLSQHEVPSDLVRQIASLVSQGPEGGEVEPYGYLHWRAQIHSPALSAVPSFREGRWRRSEHPQTSRGHSPRRAS